MNIVIRPYRESDRQAVRDLTVEAFQGVSIDQNIDRILGAVAGRDWRWRKARHVDEDIDEPTGALAIAEEKGSGRAVGYVTMLFDGETRIGWIHNMAVSAEIRNQGVGRRLLEHALARFREEGMTVAKIETLEQNPVGSHLYPALGFREVARQVHFAMDLTAGSEPRIVPGASRESV